MPSFDCGGDACGRYSCHSCTSESVRDEYWRLLGVLRDDDKARIATDAWMRKERERPSPPPRLDYLERKVQAADALALEVRVYVDADGAMSDTGMSILVSAYEKVEP